MERIHENMCFDVVFLYENIRTCLFTCTYVFLYFLHLVLTFTPHYIIMVKGLLVRIRTSLSGVSILVHSNTVQRQSKPIASIEHRLSPSRFYLADSLIFLHGCEIKSGRVRPGYEVSKPIVLQLLEDYYKRAEKWVKQREQSGS